MKDVLRVLVLGAALAWTIPAGARAADAQADEVLKQARQALGGQALAGLRSLTLSGEFQRSLGDAQMSGQMTCEIVLPDKLRRDEQMDTPMGPGPTIVTAVNGSEAWRDVENTSMSGGMIMIRRPPGAAGNDTAPVRADFQRLLLGLIADTSLLGLDAKYAGQAESGDGSADVLDLTGPGDFSARLFVARDTHLPLMLTYKGVPPQGRVRMMRGAGPHGAGPSHAPPGQEPDPASADPAARPTPVEMQMFFDGHRKVDGLMLPARVTVQAAGKPIEEWQITTITANAAIKADRFVRKSKSDDAR